MKERVWVKRWIGVLVLGLLLAVEHSALGLQIDPMTRQHASNDPVDWTAAISVKPALGEENWTATVIPETDGEDVSWVYLNPVPPGFLVYGMNENFGAEARTALIDFGGGVRFKLVQSGRGASINNNVFSFGSLGETKSLTVTALPGTTWQVKSTAAWIHILSGPTGFGTDTVRFAVDPYTEVLPREGTFVVAGNVVKVSQTGIDLTIEPSQAIVGDKLDIVSFNVTALQSRTWAPVPDVVWISVLNQGPGYGNGTVTLSVHPNGYYQPRQGRVTVGSESFLVNQAGNQNPTLSISPTESTSSRDGAQGRVNVLVSPGTPWRAASSVPWIQIVGGVPGTNSGTLAFVVSPNNSLSSRQGVITVVGADPLPAPNLRRGLASHLIFESEDAGDNLIVAQGRRSELTGFARALGRNKGQALRFNGAASWSLKMQEDQTVSFWFAVDYSTRMGTVARIAGHDLGISSEGKLTVDDAVTAVTITAESWYQVIARRSTGGLDLYCGGALLKQLGRTVDDLVFNPTGNFLGRLDDFRLYNRDLQDTEMFSLYSDEAAGNGLAIYNSAGSASQGGLPLVAKLRPDVNTIDAVSGRQWSGGRPFFEVVEYRAFQTQAYDDAKARGGILGYWRDELELAEVLGLLSRSAVKRTTLINTKDEGHEGTWTLWDERPFPGRLPWLSGEPNGTGHRAWFWAVDPNTGTYGLNAIPHHYSADAYLLRTGGDGLASLNTAGLTFSGGSTCAVRFRGGGRLVSLSSLVLESTAKSLRLSVDSGANFFDWPLPFSLDDRTHVAAVALSNKSEVAVYLDGSVLFSRPITAEILTGSSGTVSAWFGLDGEIRLYGRPLTAPETAVVSSEMVPDVQYFTLTQEAAIQELSTASESAPAAGTTLQTNLKVPTSVPWTASSATPWLQFVKGDNRTDSSLTGTGPATVSVSVSANNATAGRDGSVTIAGLEFRVTQLGRTVTLTPLSAGMTKYGENVNALVRESGGAVLLGIQPEANVSWSITYANGQDASWIVPTPSGGTGNQQVLFAVSSYNSPLSSRTAVFYIAEKQFRVTQRGYTASVSPTASEFPDEGGQGTVSVAVPSSAFWETISLSPWITIITGQSGNGSGTVTYNVASNTGLNRFGTITVGGEIVSVSQAAVSVVTERPSLRLDGTKLQVYGQIGVTYSVERSEDLISWQPFREVLGKGVATPVDLTILTSGSPKFFRAKQAR